MGGYLDTARKKKDDYEAQHIELALSWEAEVGAILRLYWELARVVEMILINFKMQATSKEQPVLTVLMSFDGLWDGGLTNSGRIKIQKAKS